jgi:DNA mismatch repair protein MutS
MRRCCCKGNAIAKGVNEELDELRADTLGKEFLEGIEARESRTPESLH